MAAKRYVIVGGSMTAHAAAQGIRELDSQGSITMIGAEPHAPYARPPLSKALWKGQPEDSVWFPEVKGIQLLTARGVIRSEIAAALSMDGRQVSMLFPEDGICARAFPKDLAAFVTGYYREKGVEVLTGDVPTAISESGAVRSKSGRDLPADLIVAGLGIAPEARLAEEAGLTVRDGIVVDAQLRTSDPDILAAGDVARFRSEVLETETRVEHEDNANTMGRLAGQSMAGASVAWRHVPMFYSDLFDLGYEAGGEIG